jgi:hypothetical protein
MYLKIAKISGIKPSTRCPVATFYVCTQVQNPDIFLADTKKFFAILFSAKKKTETFIIVQSFWFSV